MQLLKAVASTEPEISNEELLMLENEFLRNELELKDIENSIEIYECILDCIEKTGGVGKSLEVMFGENVSSSENFEAEIKAQYDSACEVAYSMAFAKQKTSEIWKRLDAAIDRFMKLSNSDLEKVRYPIRFEFSPRQEKIGTAIEFVMNDIIPKMEHIINHGKPNDEEAKKYDIEFDKIGEKFNEFVKDIKSDPITIESSDDLKKIISECKVYKSAAKAMLQKIESTLVVFGKLSGYNTRAIANAKKYLYTMQRIYMRLGIHMFNVVNKALEAAK